MQLRRIQLCRQALHASLYRCYCYQALERTEVLISVSRKQWGLNSCSEKQHVYYPRGTRENRYQGGKGRAFMGQQRAFPHTAGVGQTPELLVSFWCVWIKSAGVGCVIKRERGLKMENCFASQPFQYPPLFSARSAAEC